MCTCYSPYPCQKTKQNNKKKTKMTRACMQEVYPRNESQNKEIVGYNFHCDAEISAVNIITD